MRTQNYNPDVLTCLANLSNDEVFTPPAVVNKMLDMLPAELWSNPDAKFLDPVSKTGVFLREFRMHRQNGTLVLPRRLGGIAVAAVWLWQRFAGVYYYFVLMTTENFF